MCILDIRRVLNQLMPTVVVTLLYSVHSGLVKCLEEKKNTQCLFKSKFNQSQTLIFVSPPQPTTKQLKHPDTVASLLTDEDRKSTVAFVSPGMKAVAT